MWENNTHYIDSLIECLGLWASFKYFKKCYNIDMKFKRKIYFS